ncbi:hypothetical protein MY4824_004307 [Beauveria thailandica]
MQSNNSCTIHVERVFGPFVSSTCLGGFDFTLVFEETILTILPLSQTCKLSTNARLATALANTCLQSSYHLGALFNCEMRSQKSINHGFFLSNRSPLSVTLVTSRFFLYLSYLEHTPSVRPSTLLTLYLGLSTLLDLARVRTVSEPSSLLERWNRGYGLIAAYALAYIGIAVAYAVYELKVYRAITLFCGSLVSVIFNKTLRVSSHAASDAETMTLMSADIDRIGESMEDRIQDYLVADEQGDSNTDLEQAESKVSGSNEKDESSTTSSQEKHAVVEENVQADVSQKNDLPSTDTIFTARNVTAGYSSEKEPVLKALTFDVTKSKTTMVIGPVGCGKSTLLRLLLGEVPETSWIFRGTIRDNIVGLSTWDEPRYKSVVQACCLSADFDILPNGDRTEVGTRGSHLSGGQQMRVTLARALFSGEDVIILDDMKSWSTWPDVNGSRRVGDLKIYAYFIGVAAIWLQWWANANESHPNERTRYWLGVYATIAATAFLGSFVSDSVFQLKIVPKMMVEFHCRLLTTTMNATTRFITSKDTGTILNRFSQDLNLIDSELPSALDKTVIAILSAFFSAALAFIGSSYVGAAIPLCIDALHMIQLFYLRTSRQLRLLDIETKAPLFSLFLESIEASLAFVPTTEALQVTEWTHLETAIGAVSRVCSFVLGTEREDAVGETEDLPSEWPKSGSRSQMYLLRPRQAPDLFFKTSTSSYSDKSSCVSCLFRMLDPDTGSILIDGVDIAKAPRGELRMRLNTVPQQPFFLYGSVRENIDPLSKATDERLIEVLKTVQLWGIFEEHGGLDEDMDSDLLSHGQRQLFCLGRSMTVIAIAQKLDTILDFDRIVFLDKGKIAEIGAPRELLATEGSLFRAQYESAAN